MKKLTTYIAGPMSGYPDFNHPAFHCVAKRLRDAGHVVLNPAECDGGSTDKPWAFYMRKAILMLAQADEVLCLPGWEKSKGARLEVQIALELGMDVLEITEDSAQCFGTNHVTSVPPPPVEKAQPSGESVCLEADRLVSGDRGDAYGHPFDDFSRAGKLWAPVLGLDTVTPEQVALCMIGLKISRLCHAYKRDSATDIAGYAKCLDLVAQKRAETP